MMHAMTVKQPSHSRLSKRGMIVKPSGKQNKPATSARLEGIATNPISEIIIVMTTIEMAPPIVSVVPQMPPPIN